MRLIIDKNFILLFLAIFSYHSLFAQSQQLGNEKLWTVAEKKIILTGLERTKNEVFQEIKGLTTAQWNFKEDSSRWSIGEIVEHLTNQDESYFVEIRTCLMQPEIPQFIELARGNDDIFIAYADDPLKADAGFLSPIGKYCTREKAEFAFNKVRTRIHGIVDGTSEDLRKHFTFRRYTFKGQLSKAEKYNLRDLHQLLLTCISHTDRHLKQLRKVKLHPNYPK